MIEIKLSNGRPVLVSGFGVVQPTKEQLASTEPEIVRMLTDPPTDQIRMAKEFLSRCKPTKACNVWSYAAKHWAERWGSGYVCNGAAIIAANELGLRIEQREGGPNLYIGISESSRYPAQRYV